MAHARPGRTSLALAGDVAAFLVSAAVSGVTGVVNGASPDPVHAGRRVAPGLARTLAERSGATGGR